MTSILLLSSTTYAQGAVTHNTHMVQKTSFSKKDAQALFGTNKVKATALDNTEMKKTEGEWWQFLIPIIWGWASGVANAPSHNDPVYGGTTGDYIQHTLTWK